MGEALRRLAAHRGHSMRFARAEAVTSPVNVIACEKSLRRRFAGGLTLRYAFQAKATGANLTGTTNTVYATLIIGGDSGATSVTAEISH